MGSRSNSCESEMILGGFNNGSDSDSDQDSQSAAVGSEDFENLGEFGFGSRLCTLELPAVGEGQEQEQDVKLDVMSIGDDFEGQCELKVDLERSKGEKIESNSISYSYLNIDLKFIETHMINERLEDIQNINSSFWQPFVYLNKLSPMTMDTKPFLSSKDGAGNNNLVSKKRKKKWSRKSYQSRNKAIKKKRRANETPEKRNKRMEQKREWNKRRREKTEDQRNQRISIRGFQRNSRLVQGRELPARKGMDEKYKIRREEKLQKVNEKCSRQFVKKSLKTFKTSDQNYIPDSEYSDSDSDKLSLREKARAYKAHRRANETLEERTKRLAYNAQHSRMIRANETEDQRNLRLARALEYIAKKRRDKRLDGKDLNLRKAAKNSSQSQNYGKISDSDPAEYKLILKEKVRVNRARLKANETEEQRNRRLARARTYIAKRRKFNGKGQSASEIATCDDNDEPYSGQNPGIDVFCKPCQKFFCSPFTFNRHNKYFHPEIYKNQSYICEQCGRSFKLQFYLDDHIKFMHNPVPLDKIAEQNDQTAADHCINRPNYLCETCGKGFLSREGHTSHVERHSKILALRKEANEKTVRIENPSKNDEEIGEILSNFWNSEESFELSTRPESKQETSALMRLKMIEKITRNGWQNQDETMEQCLDRLYTEKVEKRKKDRDAETEDEKATRKERDKINRYLWIARNKDKYMKSYSLKLKSKKKQIMDKNSENHKKYDERARWANLSPEKKVQKLESIKNCAKNNRKI